MVKALKRNTQIQQVFRSGLTQPLCSCVLTRRCECDSRIRRVRMGTSQGTEQRSQRMSCVNLARFTREDYLIHLDSQESSITLLEVSFARFLPPAYVVIGGYVFTVVCLITWRDTASPSHNTSTGPMSFPGGAPSPSHYTSTGPITFLGGTPVTSSRSLLMGYLSLRQGVPQS